MTATKTEALTQYFSDLCSRAGKAGRGASKRRGDSGYYASLGKRSAKAKKGKTMAAKCTPKVDWSKAKPSKCGPAPCKGKPPTASGPNLAAAAKKTANKKCCAKP